MEELIQRCSWATTDLYKEYHDNEWGKPVHDENKLFEMLILEGMQAGLSWLTILNKREAFRIAFDNFDCKKIALYDDAKIEKLMQNSRIVRNRLKIKSAITNAQQFIKIQELAVLIRLYGLMLMVSQFSISSKLKLIYPQRLHSQTKLVKT